ncbi:hypothetical protein CHH49_18165 [Terribacillus saccharophilus]|nr:hypothetical protein CHH49_18165 [Terribacillus saccharophilus]
MMVILIMIGIFISNPKVTLVKDITTKKVNERVELPKARGQFLIPTIFRCQKGMKLKSWQLDCLSYWYGLCE